MSIWHCKFARYTQESWHTKPGAHSAWSVFPPISLTLSVNCCSATLAYSIFKFWIRKDEILLNYSLIPPFLTRTPITVCLYRHTTHRLELQRFLGIYIWANQHGLLLWSVERSTLFYDAIPLILILKSKISQMNCVPKPSISLCWL